MSLSFSGGGNPSKYALGENETRTGKQRVTENIRTDWFFEGDITIMPRGKSLRTDRRRGMKKKYKYFLIGVLSTMFLFVGCNPFAIKPWERKKLYEYYSDNANYIRVKGKITYNNAAYEKRYLSIEIDEEQYRKEYGEFLPDNYWHNNSFEIERENENILLKNGFYDHLNADTEAEFITSFYIWWDGWDFPIVGVKIGETTYLDYETGKTNLLYCIKNEWK